MLLIVGYSETDEEVSRELIAPLEDKWRVVRIGPTMKGRFSIPLPADQALSELLREIAPSEEMPGWEYLSFENQRDLGGALAGHDLGPHDVRRHSQPVAESTGPPGAVGL